MFAARHNAVRSHWTTIVRYPDMKDPRRSRARPRPVSQVDVHTSASREAVAAPRQGRGGLAVPHGVEPARLRAQGRRMVFTVQIIVG